MPREQITSEPEIRQTSSPPLTPIKECLPYFSTEIVIADSSASSSSYSSDSQQNTDLDDKSSAEEQTEDLAQPDYSSMFTDMTDTANADNHDLDLSEIGVFNPIAASYMITSDPNNANNNSKRRTGRVQTVAREWLTFSAMREAELAKKQLCNGRFTSSEKMYSKTLLERKTNKRCTVGHLADIFDESDMRLPTRRAKKKMSTRHL